jgi:hypothetical protein
MEGLPLLLEAGSQAYLNACDSLLETDWTRTRHNVTSVIQNDAVHAQGVRLLPLASFLPEA